jgi:glutamyl-tRNA reductase
MYIVAVGVSYKKTPVELRERLAFKSDSLPLLYEKMKVSGKIEGCVIISTCNRTEIYTTSKNTDIALSETWKLLADESGIEAEQLQEYLYSFTCQDAINHLFRVASGLDSMILGEMEILGQVAKAYEIACEYSASNSVLNVLFQKALKVGKKVRTETQIGQGASSVGSAAVELAKDIFGDIQNCSILLVGVGEIGKIVARNLANNSASKVLVCNRSYDKACEVASQFDGSAVQFEDLYEYMVTADLVVSCTSAPDYIITKEGLKPVMEMRKGKPIFFIDLAVPRNIDPELVQMENIYLHNIDDLQNIVDDSLNERKVEAVKAEKIVDEAIENFAKWLNGQHAFPVIEALCRKGEDIRESELEKAMRKLGPITEREEKILRSMANSIVNKLTNTAIVRIREYAQTDQGQLYTQILSNLFDLSIQINNEENIN